MILPRHGKEYMKDLLKKWIDDEFDEAKVRVIFIFVKKYLAK